MRKNLLFLFLLLSFSLAFAKDTFAMAVSNTTQQNYRWRNDDGTESTATWIATANTSITNVDTSTTIRLRFSFNETAGVAANVAARIEVGSNSDCVTGTWTALDTSSTSWQIVTSSNPSFVDLGTTTQQIGTGSPASPTYGYTSESSNPVTSVSLTTQVSEAEWAIKGVNASASTTYYFRVSNNGTALNTYTNCAQLTTAAAVAPTQVVFTNAARTLTAGVCNGAGSVFTMQLQDSGGTPRNPTGTTVIRVTSNSGNYTIYSDTGCTSPVTNGDFTYTTSENTKSVYIIDTKKSITTRTLTATQQSGPDTITTGTQNYTVNPNSHTRLVITLPGQTFTDGTGNSGTVDCNGGAAGTSCTAGTSFTIVQISATDDYFNVNTSYANGNHTLAYSGPGNAPDTTAPSYITTVNFTSGISTTTLTTTLYKAESTTITVTDGGSFGYASSSVTVDPGALIDFAVSVSTPQTAGVCFTGTNTVTARDDWGNTRTQDTSVVDMTSSGTGITFYTTGSCGTSTTQYTMSSGTSSIFILTTKKQSFTVTATKNGSTETGTSASITVNANSVTKLVITLPGQSFTDGTGNSGSPTNRTAGSSFNITSISAVDDYFNVNTSYSGAKTLAYSGPANAPDTTAPSYTTNVTFTSGQVTNLATTLYKAESTTITATDAGNYANASSSVTIDPGSISADTNDSTVSGNSSVAINTPITVTITLKDTWRNPKSAVTASHITLASSGDASFGQPSSNTDSNGQTTGTVQWSAAGSKTVQVQITVDTLVQNDGVTADADGYLDNTLGVTVTAGGAVNTSIEGSLRIKGNTRIK